MAIPPRMPEDPDPGKEEDLHEQEDHPDPKRRSPSAPASPMMRWEPKKRASESARPRRQPEARGLDLDQEPEEAQGEEEGRHDGVREEAHRALGPVHLLIHDPVPLGPEFAQECVPVLHHRA
jgi:hypothetical protein